MSDQDPLDGLDLPTAASAAPYGGCEELGRAARLLKDEQFSAFYRSVVRRLVGFLINQGATVPTAADIAQDSMIKAYRRWADLEDPRAWIHTVAARELVRRSASLREEPVESVPEATALLPRPDALGEWESRYALLPLLRALPPRQRQVLAWTLDGYTPDDIAGQLHISSDAVRSNLMKARRAVAQRLRNREEEL
ncbi:MULTISPECIES: RNA polymerase sigma factor [Streptomyces]|uniref:Sigma-70 family RNA polymerase sigma factor n=2 Tax=Streptomyces TaxID=1883 RepID=A0A2U9NWZ6_STRAS|nr:sigma-70 family RNA polymerase sigma factor [Streptomyces actuosus]AWT41823.1 sigma-70 family RNA polymerase sigma factor [Streptomyces actuosus]MBM4825571.1 sigma-70 family RNA polymerase sigma factor [Streptomyces actuosus]